MDKTKFADNIVDLTDANTDFDSDNESLLSDSLAKKVSKKSKIRYNTSLSSFPTIFFFVGLIIFAMIIIKYSPHLYNVTVKFSTESIDKSFKIKYFSSFLTEQFLLGKMLMTINQFFFQFTLICIFIFLKQSISSFEYSLKKWQNYLLMIFSCISVSSLVLLMFYPEVSQYFTDQLRLIDNMFFGIYMLATTITCLIAYLTFYSKSARSLNIFRKVYNSQMMKGYLVFFMLLTVVLYLSSLCLLSYFSNEAEKLKPIYSLGLMIAIQVNSVVFFILLFMFVYSLRYDLSYLNIDFMMKEKNSEFCVDLESNTKMVL